VLSCEATTLENMVSCGSRIDYKQTHVMQRTKEAKAA
jgi:hypothetical protein